MSCFLTMDLAIAVYRKVRCKRPPHFSRSAGLYALTPCTFTPTVRKCISHRGGALCYGKLCPFSGFQNVLGTSYELAPSDFMMLVVLFCRSKRELLRNNKVKKNRLLQEPNTLLTMFPSIIFKSRNAQRQGFFSTTSEFSTS